MIKNILSVDLESFIHRELDLSKRYQKDLGFTLKATNYLLNLLKVYNAKATFFVVVEIYEWYPELIEKIKDQGHEIAYHTHRHIILKDEKTLLEELKLSKKFLKKFNPIGFRAPRLFLYKNYLSILSDFGFKYDSSTYGSEIIQFQNINIKEIPTSFINFFWSNPSLSFPQNLKLQLFLQGLPFGSGLFLSIFQKKVQYFINYSNSKQKPAIIFIHPWQLFDYKSASLIKKISDLPRLIYNRKINNSLKYLLAKNKFISFKDTL